MAHGGCVDYRGLNKHIIKKKFPIPLVEYLLDELGGSVIFYKIVLKAGYHKLRMTKEDIQKKNIPNSLRAL